jgi:hypothetical protein
MMKLQIFDALEKFNDEFFIIGSNVRKTLKENDGIDQAPNDDIDLFFSCDYDSQFLIKFLNFLAKEMKHCKLEFSDARFVFISSSLSESKETLDIIFTDSSTHRFPDFSCNQLCVDIKTDRLSIFEPNDSSEKAWYQSEENIQLLFNTKSNNIVDLIVHEIKKRIARVMIYSYYAWKKIRNNKNERGTIAEYMAYATVIVANRALNLLNENFVITGFHPQISNKNAFVCIDCQENTLLASIELAVIDSFGLVVEPNFGQENRDHDEYLKEYKLHYFCKKCNSWKQLLDYSLN